MNQNLEYALEVNNLNVTYKDLGYFSIKKMLFKNEKIERKSFHAVKDVSFKIPKGQIWGLIGRNGSGKSTLLNAITGIFSPDSGYVDLKDNTVSLLSIGVGFKKELSGRENILISGMLLGFSKEYVTEKMNEIIEFSELGEFIDKPVRTYSSGMYSKLAFSVTASLETDIMLIDEVLSVGDESFKKKSFKKMKQLISDDNRTVIIVSHNLSTLEELCDTVMWMDSGEIKMTGNPEEVLEKYLEYME